MATLVVGFGCALQPKPQVSAAEPSISLDLFDPGRAYAANPSEKDTAYALDDTAFRFSRLEIQPHANTAQGPWLADFVFHDSSGAKVQIPSVNLLNLIPKLDKQGQEQYPEYLMEEFERFGVTFDRDDNEFQVRLPPKASSQMHSAASRVWRVGIWNNCLDPTKWEMILFSRYYLESDSSMAKTKFRARYRTLAHVWFYMDKALYARLMKIRNPDLAIDIFQSYDSLNAKAGRVVMSQAMQRPQREWLTEMQEVGHQSNRKLEEINSEQWYKKRYKIIMNRQHFYTYREILEKPVWLAPFQDRGFYQPKDTVKFNYAWLKKVDKIRISGVDAPAAVRYVNLTIDGPESPYRFELGNLDLAQLNEQKYFEMSFGFDPLPRNGRPWLHHDPCLYRLHEKPEVVAPYLYMVDKKTGKWANNQLLGFDKVYLGWESAERNVLWVYLVTYERVISVWMGRVRITDPILHVDRVQNAIYRFDDTLRYPPPNFALAREERETINAATLETKGFGDTVTMDFEALSHDDDVFKPHGYVYQEKGFWVQSASMLSAEPFRTIGKKGYGFSGSTSLINGNGHGVNILRQKEETLAEGINEQSVYFDLISLEISTFGSVATSGLEFIGVRRDSSVVTQAVEVTSTQGRRKVEFPEFKDLVAIRWVSHSTQFDNVRLVRKNPFSPRNVTITQPRYGVKE